MARSAARKEQRDTAFLGRFSAASLGRIIARLGSGDKTTRARRALGPETEIASVCSDIRKVCRPSECEGDLSYGMEADMRETGRSGRGGEGERGYQRGNRGGGGVEIRIG